MLPPTRAALLSPIIRAYYVTTQDKSYLTDCPELPSIEENGWHISLISTTRVNFDPWGV